MLTHHWITTKSIDRNICFNVLINIVHRFHWIANKSIKCHPFHWKIIIIFWNGILYCINAVSCGIRNEMKWAGPYTCVVHIVYAICYSWHIGYGQSTKERNQQSKSQNFHLSFNQSIQPNKWWDRFENISEASTKHLIDCTHEWLLIRNGDWTNPWRNWLVDMDLVGFGGIWLNEFP